MSASPDPSLAADQPAAPPPARAGGCPRFDAARLRRQLALDRAMRWAGLALVIVAVLLLGGASNGAILWPLVVLIAVAWLALSVPSARVWPLLPRISALLDADPAAAEAHLAEAMQRRPLHRHVRLLLYHRLAMLRHRQQRFAETAAICRAVLDEPLGAARRVRAHLLLLYVEASLHCGDLPSAWGGLVQLSQAPLSLLESLQRLLLETRYCLLAGYDGEALRGLPQKLQLAELMPASECAAVHAMLALAARRGGPQGVAGWLHQRAALLCPPALLESIYATAGSEQQSLSGGSLFRL